MIRNNLCGIEQRESGLVIPSRSHDRLVSVGHQSREACEQQARRFQAVGFAHDYLRVDQWRGLQWPGRQMLTHQRLVPQAFANLPHLFGLGWTPHR